MADLQTEFMMSMAVTIAVAAVIIILFKRLKQPLILGYLMAGIIAGPLVTAAQDSVELLAKLGIVLLMFSIGLEINLTKLRKIGITLIAAGTFEIVLMIGLGFQLGLALGWSVLEATLLGAILSVGSTMIIVRSLMESGGLDKERARIVVGLLIVEDFAAVVIIAAASGIVSTGGVNPDQIAILLVKMGLFVAASIVFGMMAVPRLVDYVGRQRSGELMVVTVLGLCFSMAYFASFIGFSEAIGAFVMGVLVSESKHLGDVLKQVEPIRDLFGAIFFIAVGMLVDWSLFRDLNSIVIPALVITAVFVAAKLFSCTLSVFVVGYGARNAVGAGLGMLAIGEFSLMIAAVAETSDAIRSTVYPTVILVTTMTALIVPYSVKWTDKITDGLKKRVPGRLMLMTAYLNLGLRNLRKRSGASTPISHEMRNNISNLAVNVVIVLSVLIMLLSTIPRMDDYAYLVGGNPNLLMLTVVSVCLAVIVPSLYNIWTRTIRLIEIFTSETMLATKSGTWVGYQATSTALKWMFLGFYIFVGFVVVAPTMHALIEGDIVFAAFAVAIISVVMVTLWNSIQTINSKLCEVFEQKPDVDLPTEPEELAEIENMMELMEDYGP
ncbi:MAG: cation:proton antiporter [Thermoplasmata archaeon]|nr:cation:proton antiporter [Thermoplasmata archaeon]